MAALYNLARMTTASIGTGTITLGAAVAGFLTFSAAGVTNGQTITYAIREGNHSEIGRGVYTASGTTLTRSVLKSTNGNAPIVLSGTAEVFITPAAEDIAKAASDITDATAAGIAMLTAANAVSQTALLSTFAASGAGAERGLVPSPGATAGTARFLCENATWADPSPAFVNVVTSYGINNAAAYDVSSALQSAINAICAAGKMPFIPDGTYDLGSSTITVPANGRVMLGQSATMRRTAEPSTPAPLFSLLSGATIEGGIFDNSVLSTSSTSVAIPTSFPTTVTLTLAQLARGYTAGALLYVWTGANQWMQGTVTSYSGTTLVLSITSSNGTGTFASWSVAYASANNAAVFAQSASRVYVRDVRVTSADRKWAVGIEFDICTNSWADDCEVEGVHNRCFYVYRACSNIQIGGCLADGGTICSYGFNINPANSGVSTKIKMENCDARRMAAQGFEIGDNVFRSGLSACTADTIANTGFLIQFANSGTPQYNYMTSCVANNCLVYGVALVNCFYNMLTSIECVSCGTGLAFLGTAQLNTVTGLRCDAGSTAGGQPGHGLRFAGTSSRNDVIGFATIANAGTGALFDAGSALNRVVGRSFNNTTANVTDNGTSNTKDILTS